MLRECVPRKPGDGSARRRPQHAARGGTSRALTGRAGNAGTKLQSSEKTERGRGPQGVEIKSAAKGPRQMKRRDEMRDRQDKTSARER